MIEVTLLGTGSPIPDPNRGGPATLVRAGGTTLLVDCGRGVMLRLSAVMVGAGQLDALLLTHLHSDHITDLGDVITSRWVTSFAPAPLRVFGPPGTAAVVEATLASLHFDIGYRLTHHEDLTWEPPVEVTELEPGAAFEIGATSISTGATDHRPVHPTLGFRVDHDGASVVLAGGTVGAFTDVLGLRDSGRHLRHRPATVAATLLEVATAGVPVPGPVRRQVVGRSWLRRALLWPYLHRPDALPAASVALLVDGVGTHGVLRLSRAVAGMRVERWLHEVEHPVLAVGGEHDLVAPLSELAAFERAVPHADTVVLEGTGHMVMLERADAFTDEVLAWVRKHPPGA